MPHHRPGLAENTNDSGQSFPTRGESLDKAISGVVCHLVKTPREIGIEIDPPRASKNGAAPRPQTREKTGSWTEAGQVVPCVRVFSDTVWVARDMHGDELDEVEVPLVQLTFEYPQLRARIRSNDPQPRFYAASSEGIRAVPRDFAREHDARRLLESFGVVEVDALDSVGVPPDIDADYIVRADGDRHTHCDFTARAIPMLRAAGWQVDVADTYRFAVVPDKAQWYASLEQTPRWEEDEEKPDWFALELGVEIGGRRVSLMPALLELLDEGEDGGSLASIAPGRTVALPVDESRSITLEAEKLRTLLRVLIELYEGHGDDVVFPAIRCDALEGIDEVLGTPERPVAWKDPVAARERFHLGEPAPCTEPPELRATLRPYQREGLAWLQHLRANDRGGVLADDMGLGKTLQTIAHLTLEVSEGRAQHPSLVIAPTSLMHNWKREIAKFAPHLRVHLHHGSGRKRVWSKAKDADVVLTSYPLLVRDLERLEAERWHFVVLDEAQAIKNARSQVHGAAAKLDAEHRLCLTGTPIENHLGELWSLFAFLQPDLLGSLESFRHKYRTPIERFGDEERMLALRDQVRPFILRRLKSDVAKELPPKTELLRPVELSGKQRELYESIRLAAHTKVRHVIRKKGMAAATVPVLDALMKLRQLCCDPRIVRMESARFVKQSAKYRAFFELLEQQLEGGHRVLVFSQFTRMLALLSQGLKERGLAHFLLTGQTKDRQGLCDRFEAGEADVFLISLKAGGTGLNLVSADTVIHYDPWWNPQAQAQATDRAYRIGQKKPVFVYDLYVEGSVEERMLQLQERKRRLADAILAGELPSDTRLTEDDVEVLFAPLPK